MICNQTENGWEVIFQRAHALLAAKLVTYWRPEERPLRWTETLNAVAQHDNGWQEWESGERLTESGTPRSFSQLPMHLNVEQAQRVVDRAWHQSMWVGLLVSRHVAHIHERRRGELQAMDELLDRQKDLRALWRKSLGVSQEDVDCAYRLLLWGDAFSLILCQHQLPFDERRLEIGIGPNGAHYDVYQRSDGAVIVDPWPYDRDQFEVAVDCHYLDQVTFANDDELVDALENAQIEPRRWHVTGLDGGR